MPVLSLASVPVALVLWLVGEQGACRDTAASDTITIQKAG